MRSPRAQTVLIFSTLLRRSGFQVQCLWQATLTLQLSTVSKVGLPGERAFRKPHKDTSHLPDMFESFVMFPVPHGGVELWQDEQEWASEEWVLNARRKPPSSRPPVTSSTNPPLVRSKDVIMLIYDLS